MGAVLTLNVEVRDSSGRLSAPTHLEFTASSVSDSSSLAYHQIAGVSATPAADGGAYLYQASDDRGHATVYASFGPVAGRAVVKVTAPVYGVSDSIVLTTLPGGPAKVTLAPHDTAAFPDASYPLRATVTDRGGNVLRMETVRYAAGASVASVSSAGVATVGSGYGRGVVYATDGALRDSAFVSIVPRGTIATVVHVGAGVLHELDSYYLAVLDLDGSKYHNYGGASPEGGIAWQPGADRFVTAGLVVDSGTKRALPTPSGQVLDWQGGVSFSPDGQWVYLTMFDSGATSLAPRSIWRMHLDGSAAQEVLHAAGESYTQPTASPDGAELVVVATPPAGASQLVRLSLATGDTAHIAVTAAHPTFTPDGLRLVFLENSGELATMSASGGPVQIVPSPHKYMSRDFDITPDGGFAVAPTSTALELVDLVTGEVIPLPYGADMQTTGVRR